MYAHIYICTCTCAPPTHTHTHTHTCTHTNFPDKRNQGCRYTASMPGLICKETRQISLSSIGKCVILSSTANTNVNLQDLPYFGRKIKVTKTKVGFKSCRVYHITFILAMMVSTAFTSQCWQVISVLFPYVLL